MSEANYFGNSARPWYASDSVTGFTDKIIGNIVNGSDHVTMLRYHTIFINSSIGNHNDTIGPIGQSTIARKVCINVPYGSMIHDFHSLPYDYIKLHKQSINSINFKLTDWEGHPVELNSHWSLSLIIIPEEEF